MLPRVAAAFLLAAALTLAMPGGIAQMALVTDSSGASTIYDSGGRPCRVLVTWENQGPPLVDHWTVDNQMDHPCFAELRRQDGTRIWSATVPAFSNPAFVAAQVIPDDAANFNWRRTTKTTIYSFGVSGA